MKYFMCFFLLFSAWCGLIATDIIHIVLALGGATLLATLVQVLGFVNAVVLVYIGYKVFRGQTN